MSQSPAPTTLRTEREGDVMARDPQTGQPVRTVWKQGIVLERERLEGPAAPEIPWLLPPLLDLQVNGFGGIDFQNPALTPAELETAVQALKRHACGGCLLTLITDDWNAMMEKLRRLAAFRRKSGALRSFIRGWHLEGPFLSEKDGYRGMHSARHLIDPAPQHLQDVRAIIGPDPLLLTVAPERPRAFDFIREGCRSEIRFSLGHSAADAEDLARAVAAGATGITHLGNGSPRLWERHDNWFWSVCDRQGLYVGLIPDGIHLPPRTFRGMHRALGSRHSIYLTTDAMSAAGAAPGRYGFWPDTLEVGKDGIVRQPGSEYFAGSALAPDDGVRRAALMLAERPDGPRRAPVDWQLSWRRFSVTPAAFMGFAAVPGTGDPARFCLVQADEIQGIGKITLHYPEPDS